MRRGGGRPAAFVRWLSWIAVVLCAGSLRAQDLEPRAYVVFPVRTNVAFLAYSHTSGDLVFDPSVPITNASARINAGATGYYRSLDFFGRLASMRVVVPYAWGHVKGDVQDQSREVYRSGLADIKGQFAVNLYGGKLMGPREFAAYRPGTNLWTSFTIQGPSGQYSPDKLVNVGANRWALKPEVAVTQALGRWTGELYAGAIFFTDNSEFYPGTVNKAQAPLGAYQTHLIYNFRRNLWASFDGTYYHGGHTTLDGVSKDDNQRALRYGAALSWAPSLKYSFKVQYMKVETIRIGGKFDAWSFGYAYTWFDK
jgi:hypothetical protein